MINITKLLLGESVSHSGDELRYAHHNQFAPVVVWNTTRTCNLHCQHCYMDANSKKFQSELTTQEAKKLIDDLAEFHVPCLLLSGGEPLVRPDIFEILQYCHEKNIRPTLSTNGTLITKEVAQKIKDIGVAYVGISLDGLEEENDFFRGKEGAFQAALNGIKNCKEVGQRVGLRFTIHHKNFHQVGKIFDLVEEQDIDRVCFYHMVYVGRGDVKSDLSLQDKRSVVLQILNRTRDLIQRGLPKEILTVDNHCDGVFLYLYVKNHEHNEKLANQILDLLQKNGGNRSGIAFGEIDPQGNVHPDQFTQSIYLGNVRETSFKNIWTNPDQKILQGLKDRKKLLKGRCASCGFLNSCNGNFRARALAVTGDFWQSDPACYLTDEEIQHD